jgi:hypothetical protein
LRLSGPDHGLMHDSRTEHRPKDSSLAFVKVQIGTDFTSDVIDGC